MQKKFAALLCAALLAGCGAGEAQRETAATAPPAADIVILNARVYTLSWPDPATDGTLDPAAPRDAGGWHPDAEAIALRDGRVAFVGEQAQASQHVGATTKVIDAGGATVLPGLVDSHTHVFNLGASLQRVSLHDAGTEEEAVRRVAERARSVPVGEWIVGHGWDEGAWADRYPDMRLLTEAVPEHPVYMRSLHSFAGWGNRLAFERAGIDAGTPAPSGGEIRRFADGTPNGLLLNRAVPLLEAAIPAPTTEQRRAWVLDGLRQMARDGYVTIHDAGLGTADMQILERLAAEGELPIRVYAMLSARDAALGEVWLARGPDDDSSSFLVTRSVKAYYDGALGSRGARLLEDYADAPGHRGVSGSEYGFDEALVRRLMKAGFQVGIHAIGDAGNRETLDFIESVQLEAPQTRAGRHRVEHAQVLHADDVGRFEALGVIASMEPPHAVEDKTWAEARLGPERVRGAYAWRTLREANARLTFNADNPGSDHDIFYGLHAAVTRRDKDRQPPDGWYPREQLNMDEALRAYTRWSAYAAFREDLTGQLTPGRWADVTIIDIDPFVVAQTNPDALLEGRVLGTIVAGELVFDAISPRDAQSR